MSAPAIGGEMWSRAKARALSDHLLKRLWGAAAGCGDSRGCRSESVSAGLRSPRTRIPTENAKVICTKLTTST